MDKEPQDDKGLHESSVDSNACIASFAIGMLSVFMLHDSAIDDRSWGTWGSHALGFSIFAAMCTGYLVFAFFNYCFDYFRSDRGGWSVWILLLLFLAAVLVGGAFACVVYFDFAQLWENVKLFYSYE